jgi:hypothetical protein
VPSERIDRIMVAVIDEARARTRGLVELPAGEDVVLEIVRDKPWLASCDYLGDLRSRIAVNVDLPKSAMELLRLYAFPAAARFACPSTVPPPPSASS